MQEEVDYEQLYYDVMYENKQLKKKIEELENDLNLVDKITKKKINIKKEIMKEIMNYIK